MSKLTKEDKESLRKIPIKKCSICKKRKKYTNPIAKCFECKNHFCYDHISGGQFCDGMKDTEKLHDICTKCKGKFDYKNI